MPAAEHEGREIVGRACLLSLAAIVAWAPLPLGSNRAWSAAMLAFAVGLTAAAWALARALRGGATPRALREHRVALGCLGLWVGYTALQAAPLGASVVGLLAPATAGAYEAARAAGAEVEFALSVDRAATLHAVLRHAAYAGVAMLALALADSRRRLRFLLAVLAAVGFAQAAFAIVAHFAPPGLGLWDPGHGVSGTYVNPNHLAGLLELCIPAAAALLWLEVASAPRRAGARGQALRVVHVLLGTGLLAGFALAVMGAALLLTASRAGLAGALAGLGLAIVLAGWGRARAGTLLRRLAWLALAPVLAATWLGADALIDKLAETGLESNRGDLRESAYAMIGDRAMFGSGAGTYRWVMPAYKDERLGTRSYEHAHNDLLELAVEQGAVGVALAGLGAGLLLAATARGALSRRDPTVRAALFAALGGSGALVVHGAVDFNLQIPANATIFFLLLGIGGAAATLPSRRRPAAPGQGSEIRR